MTTHLDWTTCFAVAGYVVANPPVRAALGFLGRGAMLLNWRRVAAPAFSVIVVLALLTEAPMAAQTRRTGSRSGATQATGADPKLTQVVASFQGTLRAVTKKDFTVELENGNTVEFKLTKKTAYFLASKQAQAKDLAVDQVVTVEGSKDAFGVLSATKVTVKEAVKE